MTCTFDVEGLMYHIVATLVIDTDSIYTMALYRGNDKLHEEMCAPDVFELYANALKSLAIKDTKKGKGAAELALAKLGFKQEPIKF